MGKKKGLDVISDAHERAKHNMNPYYWFNRVTPFTIAQWRASKRFSPLFFIMFSIIGVLILDHQSSVATEQGKSLLGYLFDFSDSFTSAKAVGFLLLFFYWIVLGIGTFQSISERLTAPLPKATSRPKKKKEKKHPKRRKDYR